MIVKMKTGVEYLISDQRGSKLKLLLDQGTNKEFINLDGRGMMVAAKLIESVTLDKPINPTTEAWKQAIRHNLETMRQTGRMGHATAQDFLTKTAVVTG